MSHLPLAPGLVVETFDGHRVGSVAAVEPNLVLIRPSHGKPFWLDEILVRDVEESRVVLQVERSLLKRYRPGTSRFWGGAAKSAFASGTAVLNLAMLTLVALALN